jgi:hypothetical protein
MGRYYFVMGFPYAEQKNDRQKELYAALESNADKAPISMTVYLIKDNLDRLWTVCEWPDSLGNLEDKLWGQILSFVNG